MADTIPTIETTIQRILSKENIKYKEIKKSSSGFSNLVYFVDHQFVLKIQYPNEDGHQLKKEISFYQNVTFSFIPKYKSSGSMDGLAYLLIDRVKGEPLYNIWHTLTSDTRESIMRRLTVILKTFHEQTDYTFLPSKYICSDPVKFWENAFQKNIAILNDMGYDASNLSHFVSKHLSKIMEEHKPGLVYNDTHFDNLIYDGENLFLIDFDRILYGSIDYELTILYAMVNNPKKFANESTELLVQEEDYQNIIPIFKQDYPKLFQFQFLEDRIFIYTFFYQLGNAYEYHLDDLIEKCLSDFQNRFHE